MRISLIFFAFICGLSFSNKSYAMKEDWYWGFSLGSCNASFGDPKATTISNLASDPSYSSMSTSSELFLYFPVVANGILGVSVGGGSKAFYHSSDKSQNQIFGQSSMSASWIQSFGDEPGTGLLLRGDVGYGTIYQTTGTSFFPSPGSETGLALKAGIGYGFQLGVNTHILIMASAAQTYSNGTPNYYAISIAPLF